MLLRLKISNYALISQTQISFKDGLTVITGETGAGKSILMGALSMVMGARADSSVIKQGEKKTVVEADFDIHNYNLKQFFEENDLDYDDIALIRREISDSGKSRAFINDTPVNLNTLKELGTLLIDIHSQHQTLEISSEEFQLSIVDAFAKNKDLLEDYKIVFGDYRKKSAELSKLEKQALESKKESEYLHFRYDELAKANLQEGEQKELEDELDMLTHNEDIKTAISTASNLIISADEATVLEKLKESKTELHKISSYYPKALELYSRIDSVYIELQDIGRELSNLDENTEYSPERLETVNSRLTTIYNLEKKHGVKTVEELISERDSLKAQLDLVENSDERISDLKKELSKIVAVLKEKADKITESRRASVQGLKNEIVELLSSVGINDAKFDVEFSELKEFLPEGLDRVRFMFSANKNVALSDLSKTASGGELSRLMLCLKYILSRSTKLPTIIFDEIDTGISGDVAGKTGQMFKKIAGFMQVICITHLPQVASKGDNHFKVFKHEENGAIRSDIRELTMDERVNEIAGMLSGEKISQAALDNAKELLGV
ncbi:MAG: DNA repair protein RecN [Bacteroidales bacterium]|nr:DNA repair protein RecN [Bacteroidales bacterium]MBR6277739.1 DNA repair protein RecN [Bacteroidales bacterium]